MYDALYGTDVIPGEKFKDFNEKRADKVIEYVRKFLDEVAPINDLNWNEISEIKIQNRELVLTDGKDEKNLKNKIVYCFY